MSTPLDQVKNEIIDSDRKIMVTGVGLCVHMSLLYEQHQLNPNAPDTAECHICNKKWEFSLTQLKFVEV